MPRRRPTPEQSLRARLRRQQQAGLTARPRERASEDDTENPELTGRLDALRQACLRRRRPTDVLCFVMYDIEDNRVRQQIAKYLLRKGCVRVQKSVYLADLDQKTYREIRQTLGEVNDLYENHDSILIVPVTSGELARMAIIGQNIQWDLIGGDENTLFF